MRSFRRSTTAKPVLLATAIALQVALLAALDTASAPWLVAAGLAITAVIALRARRAWRGDVIDAALVAACLGGLGMLAGGLLDARADGPMPVPMSADGPIAPHTADHEAMHHGAMHHETMHHETMHHRHEGWRGALTHLASWSTLGMLALCVPACLLLCPGPAPTRCHAFGTLGMLAGMVAAAALLGPTLAEALGSPVLGGHLAMLLGMSLGTALGLGGARVAVRRAGVAHA